MQNTIGNLQGAYLAVRPLFTNLMQPDAVLPKTAKTACARIQNTFVILLSLQDAYLTVVTRRP